MSRGLKAKVAIIFLMVLLVVMLGLTVLTSEKYNQVTTLKGADDALSYYTADFDAEWTTSTYHNAPSFTQDTFLGKSVFAYFLDTNSDEQYSTTASLISSATDAFKVDGVLSFYYYTRQEKSLPHVISAYGSSNGEDFYFMDKVECFDNGADSKTWSLASLDVKKDTRFLKLEWTVYFGKVDGIEKEDGGLLVNMDDITVTCVEDTDFSLTEFSFELVKSAYYYDGKVIEPEYRVSADTLHSFYTDYYFEQGGMEIEPIDVGSYDIFVDVYNQAGRLCYTFSDVVEILPETIVLESYEIINNGTYAVLIDATFTDARGRKIDLEEAQAKRVYDGTQEVIVEVGSDNFTPYQTNLGVIETDVTAPYAFYLNEIDVVATYDGNVKSINDNIKVFSSYDFDTDAYVEYGATFAITYLDEDGNETMPLHLGKYTYSIPFGRREIKGTLTINPRVITMGEYVGGANLDKKYDGTTFLAVDGIISEVLPTDSIALSDIIDGDQVSIAYNKAKYVKEVGLTYLTLEGITLDGANANDYVVSEDFYVNANAKISPTTVVLRSLNTENGTVYVEEKEYDGTNVANLVGAYSALDVLGAGSTEIFLSDLTATFDGIDSGVHDISLTITNRALFDRFLPEVVMDTELKATIKRRNLQAEASIVSGADKIYDGTTIADIEITKLNFNEIQDYGDGFIDVINSNNYYVKYDSAFYNNANAGDKKITVTNLYVNSNDFSKNSILNNYYIDSVILDGKINAKVISILTEYVRIYEGEALPNLKTTVEEMGITAMTIHASVTDAENNENVISNVRIPSGEYFIRVSCTSNNYTLGGVGYVIVPLTVTAINQKINQEIIIDNVDVFSSKITMLVGGELTLNAISYTEYNGSVYETGLTPEYRASGSAGSVSVDGTVYASEVGAFVVTVSQSGNENYNRAKDVVLNVEVIEEQLSVEYEYDGELYVDDLMPNLNGYVDFKVGTTPVAGTAEHEEGNISFGESQYVYYFIANPYYAEYLFEGTLLTRYELVDDKYVLSEDSVYVAGKTYYIVEGIASEVTVGEEIVPDTYYELVDNVYVLTEDTIFAEDKFYYTLNATVDTSRTIKGTMYEKVGEEYFVTTDSEMIVGKTYYYLTKSIYGKTPFNVTLVGQKRVLNVTLSGNFSIEYSEEFDFNDALNSAEIAGQLLSYEDIIEKISGGGYKLYNVQDLDGELTSISVNVSDLLPSIYNVGVVTGGENTYYLDFDDENLVYDIVLSGSLNLTINKSALNVKIENFEKYYYQDLISEEQIKSLLKVEGNYKQEDIEDILSSVNAIITVDKYSAPGEYGVTLNGSNTLDKYQLNFVDGYISILPIPVTVYASANGHEYGRKLSDVNLNILFDNADCYSREDMILLQDIISKNTTLSVDVTKDSPVGDYYIYFEYSADNNFYDFKYLDSYYTVRTSSFTDMLFKDKYVLYDGNRHTMEIEYNVNQWPNIKVEYNYTYFVEPGEYLFVATVSQPNYTTTMLEATLYIGVLTINSSNLSDSFVQMTIIDETCITGINSAYALTLIKGDEITEAQASVIGEKMSEYNVLGVYGVLISHGVESVIMGYTGYEIKFTPSDFKDSENVKLFGYKDGVYQEIEYKYEDGMITVQVDSLEGIVIAEEIIKEMDMTSAWIFVAVILIVILLVLGIISKHLKKHKKFKARSRKRHHRWA